MKKLIALWLAIAACVSAVGFSGYALFGSGYRIVASDVKLIKTGLYGKKLTFSDSDFKSAYAITDFDYVTVDSIPPSNEGTLLLSGRRVKEGQKIKRKNVAAMVFVPASTSVGASGFNFTLTYGGTNTAGICEMKFIDRINYAPKVPEEKESSLTLTTQAEISVFGHLEGSDPEGDKLEYIIARYPKNGSLYITDKEIGAYKYTPTDSFTGYDSFTYVLRDEYGNYSEPREVGIRIVERMSSEVYADMKNRSEYNAAVAMSALGIMSGKTLGDDKYFMPDETVSKAEFVAMAMKASGMRADSSLTKTFFDDNTEIPASLVSYVATAQRLGIVDGDYTDAGLIFEPNRGITKNEAAKIITGILGLRTSEEDGTYLENATVSVSARASVYAMFTLGIFDGNIDDFTGTDIVTRAEAAEYLYRM
ncbi:MAG: S-layer homology domain-containing protein [Clostridia bacterium]|nr:S-layer homology domain-containing protein [Clostridia bacterium]